MIACETDLMTSRNRVTIQHEVNMKAVAFFFSPLLIPATISAQDRVQRDQHQMHRLHRDPKCYIGALEDPKRELYQKPQEVIMVWNAHAA
jgi:hypothetical protein